MDYETIIKWTYLLIKWVPLLIFILFVAIEFLKGFARGLRKSLIFLVASIVCGSITLVLYYIFVSSEKCDQLFLSIFNSILGSGGIEKVFGVLTPCTSLSEVLLEFVIHLIGNIKGNGPALEAIARDNGEYLATLVNLAYHIVFAIICLIIYWFFNFIFKIVYSIGFNDKKHAAKVAKKFSEGKADRSFKKQHIRGGIVGIFRGAISGIICLSMIGGLLFVVAGDGSSSFTNAFELEQSEKEELNENSREIAERYYFISAMTNSIRTYGSEGIYKLLNGVQDKNDVPVYLFVSDLIFEGTLKESQDKVTKVVLRNELSSITGPSLDLLDLVLKYGGEDIKDIVIKKKDGNLVDVLSNVFFLDSFQEDFKNIMKDIDTDTFISKTMLSLVEAFATNAKDLFGNQLNSAYYDLLRVLFEKDYLSEFIPEEIELRKRVDSGEITIEDCKRAYLSKEYLFNREDVKIIYETFLKVFKAFMEETDASDFKTISTQFGKYMSNVDGIVEVIHSLLDSLSSLSAFKEENKDIYNPILCRVFSWIQSTMLNGNVNQEQYDENTTLDELIAKSYNKDMVAELRGLVNVSSDISAIVEMLYGKDFKSSNIISQFSLILNDEEGKKHIDNVLDVLASSNLIGEVLSSNSLYVALEKSLKTLFNSEMNLPLINYNNYVDEEGNMVYGELFYVIGGLKYALSSSVKDDVMKIMNKEVNLDFENDMNGSLEFVGNLLNTLISTRDSKGYTFVDYIENSKILNAVVNSAILNLSAKESIFYIPEIAKENGIISSKYLTSLVESLPNFIDAFIPYTDSLKSNPMELLQILNDERIRSILYNPIMEGIVSNAIVNNLKDNDTFILSTKLQNVDNWISTNNKVGELDKLLDAVLVLSDNLSALMEGLNGTGDYKNALNVLSNLSEYEVEKLLASEAIYYSLSNILLNKNTFDNLVIIPKSATVLLNDSVLERGIKQTEIINFINNVKVFLEILENNDSNDSMDSLNTVLSKVISNSNNILKSDILSSTIVFYLNSGSIVSTDKLPLTIPEKLKVMGAKEKLVEYETTNPWRAELPNLFDAMDELFGISAGNESIDLDKVVSEISNIITSLNEKSSVKPNKNKLDVFYSSSIIKSTLTDKIDNMLLGFGIDANTIRSAKDNSGFYPNSEINAFATAVDFFFGNDDFDVTDNDFTTRILDNFLNLNEINEHNEDKTTLELIYQSVIIKSLSTQEIDKVFNQLIETQSEQDKLRYLKVDLAGNYIGYYNQSEVANLIDSLNIIIPNGGEFKASNINPSQIFANIIDGTTSISDITKSKLLAFAITHELDKILASSNIVDEAIYNSAYTKEHVSYNDKIYLYYKSSELSDLVNALIYLNIDDLDSLGANGSTAINNLIENPNDLEEVYSSYIIKGIFTKSLNNVELIKSHPRAYYNEIEAYKDEEVKSLLEFLKLVNVADANAFDLNEFSKDANKMNQIINFVYNEQTHAPRSYLVSSSLSNLIKTVGSSQLIIPNIKESSQTIIEDATLDAYDNITSEELYCLLNALKQLDFSRGIVALAQNFVDDARESGQTGEETTRKKFLDSVIIRATISQYITDMNNDSSGLYIGNNCSNVSKAINGNKIIIISYNELNKILKILATQGEDAFSFNSSSAITNQEMLESEILRLNASMYIKKQYEKEVWWSLLYEGLQKDIISATMIKKGSGINDITTNVDAVLFSKETIQQINSGGH